MPVNGEIWIDNLTHNEATTGVIVRDMYSIGAGAGPNIVVIFASASGLPANHPSISITLNPSGKSTVGTDVNGNISVSCTFTDTGDGKIFATTGPNTPVTLDEGFYNQLFTVTLNTTDGLRSLYMQVQYGNVDDAGEFPGVPPPPAKPDKPTVTLDSATGDVTLSFTYTETVDDEIGYVVNREKTDTANPTEVVIGAPLKSDGVGVPTAQQIIDNLDLSGEFFGPGTYTYTVRVYKKTGTDTVSEHSITSDPIVYGGGPAPPDPDILIPDPLIAGSGIGGIEFGGSAEVVFIGNPSGIYTLSSAQTHDTLYERIGATTSVNVKIPDPFIRTGFV